MRKIVNYSTIEKLADRIYVVYITTLRDAYSHLVNNYGSN